MYLRRPSSNYLVTTGVSKTAVQCR